MEEETLPYVIVGAGPVGLTLAYGLARHFPSHPIVVLEAAGEPAVGATSRSYPVYLSPRSTQFFDQIGISLAKANTWKNFGVSRNGRPMGRIESLGMARGSLVGCLMKHCRTLPKISFQFGKRVGSIVKKDQDKFVCIEFTDGSSPLDASFVFDCSGCRSAIRKAAIAVGALTSNVPAVPSDYHVKFLRFANVPPSLGYDPDYMHILRDKNMSGRLQKWGCDGPNAWVLSVDLHSPLAAPYKDETSFDAFAGAVLKGLPALLPYVVRSDEMPESVVLSEFWLSDFVWGDNVVFLGDAAHVASPIMAQGLNAGLADVRALLKELSDGKSISEAAVAYSARQTLEGRALVLTSNKMSAMVKKPVMLIVLTLLHKLFPSWIHASPSARLYEEINVSYDEVWRTWQSEIEAVKRLLVAVVLILLVLVLRFVRF
ncbi:hypothetical protein AC1031_013809 [Aphanomyces cochlioides]|nr:hypothetical protein AC1031_013809 [Aphanomyces cochlioides]